MSDVSIFFVFYYLKRLAAASQSLFNLKSYYYEKQTDRHRDGEYYLILFSSSEAGVSCILI